jgi:hypothetical protein
VTVWIHPAAEAEHLAHVRYYRRLHRALGARYLADFNHVTLLVAEAPDRYQIVRSPDVRIIAMRQFPYSVIYRHHGSDIQILAVAHIRRRPGYWTVRV